MGLIKTCYVCHLMVTHITLCVSLTYFTKTMKCLGKAFYIINQIVLTLCRTEVLGFKLLDCVCKVNFCMYCVMCVTLGFMIFCHTTRKNWYILTVTNLYNIEREHLNSNHLQKSLPKITGNTTMWYFDLPL